MFRLMGLLVLLWAIPPAHAAGFDKELTDARGVFLQGVDGDKHAVRTAVKRFRFLSQSHPEDPVYIAYLGASMTLEGRDAQNGINKQRLTEAGLGQIDHALEMLSEGKDVPPDRRLDAMLVAANSFIYIPSFFNRYDRGKRLLHGILDNSEFDAMHPGFKAATYYTAALVAHGDGDEDGYHKYLQLAVDTDPDGRDGRHAGELLKVQ